MTSKVPLWVTIDSASGALNIAAPEVSADTEYDFYIDSTISGVVYPIQKLVKLKILNWAPSNWKKCISSNSTIWEVCNSGYFLVSGACQTSSDTAQALSTTITSIVIAITGVVVLTSLINTSSITSLWMTINQLQLFLTYK